MYTLKLRQGLPFKEKFPPDLLFHSIQWYFVEVILTLVQY
jgi:hypothetical protein